MNEIEKILHQVKHNKISINKALELLKKQYYDDIGYAKIDFHREARVGFPEIIYCEGKTTQQVEGIVNKMYEKGINILGTRANKKLFQAIKKTYKKAWYSDIARIFTITQQTTSLTKTYIAIVAAGTSDIPVAEESALCAEFFGNQVKRIYDVGVAGIHRLFDTIELLRNAKVLIVVAGMEGALPSVIAGLVKNPIIAVPTSVGYGANFGGLSALLAMLNSCAGGVSVVNINNGFGAAYQASIINKL